MGYVLSTTLRCARTAISPLTSTSIRAPLAVPGPPLFARAPRNRTGTNLTRRSALESESPGSHFTDEAASLGAKEASSVRDLVSSLVQVRRKTRFNLPLTVIVSLRRFRVGVTAVRHSRARAAQLLSPPTFQATLSTEAPSPALMLRNIRFQNGYTSIQLPGSSNGGPSLFRQLPMSAARDATSSCEMWPIELSVSETTLISQKMPLLCASSPLIAAEQRLLLRFSLALGQIPARRTQTLC